MPEFNPGDRVLINLRPEHRDGLKNIPGAVLGRPRSGSPYLNVKPDYGPDWARKKLTGILVHPDELTLIEPSVKGGDRVELSPVRGTVVNYRNETCLIVLDGNLGTVTAPLGAVNVVEKEENIPSIPRKVFIEAITEGIIEGSAVLTVEEVVRLLKVAQEATEVGINFDVAPGCPLVLAGLATEDGSQKGRPLGAVWETYDRAISDYLRKEKGISPTFDGVTTIRIED